MIFTKEVLSHPIVVAGKLLHWEELGDDVGFIALDPTTQALEVDALTQSANARRDGIQGPVTLDYLAELKKASAANEVVRATEIAGIFG